MFVKFCTEIDWNPTIVVIKTLNTGNANTYCRPPMGSSRLSSRRQNCFRLADSKHSIKLKTLFDLIKVHIYYALPRSKVSGSIHLKTNIKLYIFQRNLAAR